jgi:hypothetical protein
MVGNSSVKFWITKLTLCSLDHSQEGFIINELDLNILEDSSNTYSVRKGHPCRG